MNTLAATGRSSKWPAPDRRIVRKARLVGLALVDRPEHESPLVDGGRGRSALPGFRRAG